MVTAYIMVKAAALTNGIDQLKEDLLAVDNGIESAHIVAGDVDFIVKVDVESPTDVKDIAGGIQSVEGIEDTQTYITMD
ncbi:Lrp/AsnC family transcriptional regulator [Haloferax mediterranei ATCC 33500]|uniref:Transcriptional regulator n=1 Tax=Haloferax mediterranei (strain ATCC 33500 / DSM 1411 / JCM 8866 / NBRC 14739 / NCIMB 2177 / R-4) TaxID=523841 RepID=I3R6U7_HALMT|nr:Lrp/AsnC ligand binding domain-containing protein [Haloferax mediterranei]AFK19957.1 transcription regulator [Haloferax mediterranei ATCC 33500]AHZ23333.1 transcriptional regulator [Haloferax mediterranei ATCC 33500]ELZ99501.1 transcriptional regulator [Haloferax mediterranei ATCC 33500]MDX5987294.1 Lrp/AsnC ligand binding domain-containing protein [Haloferax mediterranei ATCC 33500]QCQ73814.1 Lrp/AsnC family transcriptional regulator [Haloferax mediterranei ATCC 33500]